MVWTELQTRKSEGDRVTLKTKKSSIVVVLRRLSLHLGSFLLILFHARSFPLISAHLFSSHLISSSASSPILSSPLQNRSSISSSLLLMHLHQMKPLILVREVVKSLTTSVLIQKMKNIIGIE